MDSLLCTFNFQGMLYNPQENRKDWKLTSCDFFKLFSFTVPTLYKQKFS